MSEPAAESRLGELLAYLEEIHGAVTPEEMSRARAEWPTDDVPGGTGE